MLNLISFTRRRKYILSHLNLKTLPGPNTIGKICICGFIENIHNLYFKKEKNFKSKKKIEKNLNFSTPHQGQDEIRSEDVLVKPFNYPKTELPQPVS